MARKNRTTINGQEFFTDEEGNIKGKVNPSYKYQDVNVSSKDVPGGIPSVTALGQQQTQQATDRAKEQVLNEAARSAEDIDAKNSLKESYNKAGVNPSNKQIYDIVDNAREESSDGIFKDLNQVAAENAGLAGTGEQDLTDEQKAAMQLSMDKRIAEDKMEMETLRDNPGISEEEATNLNNMKKEALDEEERKAGNPIEEKEPEEKDKEPSESEEEKIPYDEYKALYDDYRLPKNGAEYLKSLWGQGAGGKAKAIGNVLGNLFGAVGNGLNKQGYTSDWEDYANNYQKEMAERNSRIFNDNMDIVKQARTNEQMRKDLLAQVDMAVKNGAKVTPEALKLMQIWATMTTPSSAVEKGIAALLTKIGL